MTQWDDRVKNHPIFADLSNLDDALDRAESLLDETGGVEAHQRLRQVRALTRRVLDSLDPALTPLVTLDNLGSPVRQAIAEINNFVNDRNLNRLMNANAQADQVLHHLALLRPPTAPTEVEGLGKAVASFRQAAGRHLRSMENEIQDLRVKIASLHQQLDTHVRELEAQKGRLDAAIAEYQKQFSEAEAKRREQFGKTVQESADAFREFLDQTKESVTAFMKDLEGFKQQAIDLVHAIGSTGMTGAYREVANREARMALLWRRVAAGAMVGIIAFAIYAMVAVRTGFEPGSFFPKLTVSAAFGVLAAYAAREAHKHRKAEQRSRKFELELASIDPYTALLPAEQRFALKIALADRMFGRPDTDEKSRDESPGVPSVLDFVAKMSDLLLKK